MVKMIMTGCNGRMGHVIADIVAGRDDIEIVAGVDINGKKLYDFPTYLNITELAEDIVNGKLSADVIVDFTNPAGTKELLEQAVRINVPVVLCTTGLNEELLAAVNEASKKIAILRSANMSLGINLLMKLVNEAAAILCANGFDPEIVEMHHNQKLDAPSGTAIALAESLNAALNNEYEFVYDRSQRREKRPQKEIGISAVRGGSIVGDHNVIFAGLDEVIEIRHTAYSRAIFAKGAVAAAVFLKGKAAGMYNMQDVVL